MEIDPRALATDMSSPTLTFPTVHGDLAFALSATRNSELYMHS